MVCQNIYCSSPSPSPKMSPSQVICCENKVSRVFASGCLNVLYLFRLKVISFCCWVNVNKYIFSCDFLVSVPGDMMNSVYGFF